MWDGYTEREREEEGRKEGRNVMKASEFHKKQHANSKGLKKDFSIIGTSQGDYK